jgi:hypothetical protein
MSNTVGVGFGGGKFGIGGARTSTAGTGQSLLAEQLAPPEKMAYVLKTLIVIVSLYVGSYSWSGNQGLGLLAFGIAAITGFLLYGAISYNRNTWPREMAEWKMRWVCLTCGQTYQGGL